MKKVRQAASNAITLGVFFPVCQPQMTRSSGRPVEAAHMLTRARPTTDQWSRRSTRGKPQAEIYDTSPDELKEIQRSCPPDGSTRKVQPSFVHQRELYDKVYAAKAACPHDTGL